MQEKFVSIEELADFFSVSVSTVRAWIKNGTLTSNDFLKIGNTYRFKISEIEIALRRNTANTSETQAPEKLRIDSPQHPIQEKKFEPAEVSSITKDLVRPTPTEIVNQIDLQIQLLYEIYENILQSLPPREAEIWRLRVAGHGNWKQLGLTMKLSPSWVKRLFERTWRKMKHPARMHGFSNMVKSVFSENNSYSISANELEVRLRIKDEGLYVFYKYVCGSQWSKGRDV